MATKEMAQAEDVIKFWFEDTNPKQWYKKNIGFDQRITDNFSEVHNAANRGELYTWRKDIQGRLAEIIILDQFSRNIFRGTARAFASDPLALCLAQEAIATGNQHQLNPEMKSFFYMPYMHSESKMIHKIALELFSEPDMKSNYGFELRHKEIIDRFGRYPHRNDVLGRESTLEELEFLAQPRSSF